MSATDPRIAAGIDAVSRAVYDLAQLHVSPLDVNVGVAANGVMRLSLTEAVEIAFRAADAAAAPSLAGSTQAEARTEAAAEQIHLVLCPNRPPHTEGTCGFVTTTEYRAAVKALAAADAVDTRVQQLVGEVTNAAMGLPFDHPVRVVLTRYAVASLNDAADYDRTFDDEHDGSVLRSLAAVSDTRVQQLTEALSHVLDCDCDDMYCAECDQARAVLAEVDASPKEDA